MKQRAATGHAHWLARRVAQGIGGRPLAFALASELGLTGWVRNRSDGLQIALWGPPLALAAFPQNWRARFPLPPAPPLVALGPLTQTPPPSLSIAPSVAGVSAQSNKKQPPAPWFPLAPDLGLCPDCARELHDPASRRFHDPLIGCTRCGPRLCLTQALPFDRQHTAWGLYPPCPDCQREYVHPADRRFHSQTIACPRCGPAWRVGPPQQAAPHRVFPLTDVTVFLQGGGVLLAKGVGGHHLLCRAGDAGAVALVRAIKHRPVQPLAVVVADLSQAARLARLNAAEKILLTGPRRPLVLVARLTGAGRDLAARVAPHHGVMLGLMLPVSGLHHLLAHTLGEPLVCTSANLHGQPMPLGEKQWPPLAKRGGVGAQPALWLAHHDLAFGHATDDTVAQMVAGGVQLLRRARGFAPQPIALPWPLAIPTVALGGDLCSVVAVGAGRWAWPSPHLGDQQVPEVRHRARRWLEQMLAHLGLEPQRVLVDAHPGYHVGAIAAHWPGATVTPVFHHRAHAAQVLAEHPRLHGPALVATWDGTGFGEDHSAWGAEVFLGEAHQPQHLRRVATAAAVPLPGGEAAIRQPGRWALPWVQGQRWPTATPRARSVGRLFDAAAVLLDLGEENTFEADLPLRVLCAALAHTGPPPPPLALHWQEEGEVLALDSLALLQSLRSRFERGEPATALAWAFHAALAAWLAALAQRFATTAVLLSGGCFANRLLVEQVKKAVPAPVFLPRHTPPGDGGLAWGQLALAAALDREGAF